MRFSGRRRRSIWIRSSVRMQYRSSDASSVGRSSNANRCRTPEYGISASASVPVEQKSVLDNTDHTQIKGF